MTGGEVLIPALKELPCSWLATRSAKTTTSVAPDINSHTSGEGEYFFVRPREGAIFFRVAQVKWPANFEHVASR
jgi:hypothetical protein